MKKSSHVQYDIQYHIVWTTKYRFPVLRDKIAERARYLIRQCCNSIGVTLIKGSVSKAHILVLVSCPTSLSVSRLVQQLKDKTSRTLQMEFKELKSRYWGQYLWSVGYLCRKVEDVTEQMIKDYIENQTDESDDNFKILC